MVAVLGHDRESIRCLTDFLLMDHVLPRLDGGRGSFMGLLDLVDRLRAGHLRAFAALEGGRVAGVAYGQADGDAFVVHVAFERHARAPEAAAELEAVIARVTGCRRIVGYIPETNRPARLFARRCGARDCGIDPGAVFADRQRGRVPCIKYEKEIAE